MRDRGPDHIFDWFVNAIALRSISAPGHIVMCFVSEDALSPALLGIGQVVLLKVKLPHLLPQVFWVMRLHHGYRDAQLSEQYWSANAALQWEFVAIKG